MWEAAARAARGAARPATAASATRSTRWATAAGSWVVVVVLWPAATGVWRCAATRRPPPSCWARVRARPCRCSRGTSLLEQAPLPGPEPGPRARLAPAPTRVLGRGEVGGAAPAVLPFSAERRGPVLGRRSAGAGTFRRRGRFQSNRRDAGASAPGGPREASLPGTPLFWLASVLQALGNRVSRARACLHREASFVTPGWCRLVASTATGSSAASSVLRRAASATPTAC